jgi:Putative transposase/Transposase zinc-binding domain
MTPVATVRPEWEVADVIRDYGEAFLSRHGGRLSGSQTQALRDLARCRTAALGGHVERCLDCGRERIAYNSCRNRHCPKCQAQTRARWLEREADNLLPVEYFHVVFTLPEELAELALANRVALYDLLFQSAAATLREVAANPKWLGVQVGVLMVLHTWGQNLHHHPHVHAVVTGGGLSCDARGEVEESPRWLSCRKGFFLPVRVLSRVFRGKYLDGVRKLAAAGRLTLPDRLADPNALSRWLTPLYRKDWVVYAKRPFGGPQQVLKYLARYTHRVAISNSRLVDVADGRVTFRYKDYADAHRSKTMTLTTDEFLRRFVQHVLPKGFVKVRHYGLLANRCREERLALCRRLLLVENVRTALSAVATEGVAVEPAATIRCCPHCGSRRIVCLELPTADGDDAGPPSVARVMCNTS